MYLLLLSHYQSNNSNEGQGLVSPIGSDHWTYRAGLSAIPQSP